LTRLERSLALLVRLNDARLAHGRQSDAAKELERLLKLHDDECRKHGQMSLLDHEPRPVPEKPSACDECGARVPAQMATLVDGIVKWLCARCRDGRLPEDERRSLEAHARSKSNGGTT